MVSKRNHALESHLALQRSGEGPTQPLQWKPLPPLLWRVRARV